jgi:peptide/nickel transport system permease protein
VPRGFARLRRVSPWLAASWLVIATIVAWAVVPGLFTGYSGTVGTAREKLLPPGGAHPLGTDELGRDLLARIIHGSGNSITGAVVAVGLGLVLGTLVGLLAGSLGKMMDSVLMRTVDVLLAIPALLLSLSIIIILGFGTVNAAIAVGVVSVASFARLARSEVLKVRRSDYVEAAFGSGGRFGSVLWRHVLPNSAGPVISLVAMQFGAAILAISTLGFLGYGAPPPTPEWGLLIAEGRKYVATAWWLTTFPGLVVVAVVLSANRISRSVGKDQL